MTVTFKKKFVWKVNAKKEGKVLFKEFCKVLARPNIKIEEVEINDEWIPGKAEWEHISIKIQDIPPDHDSHLTSELKNADEVELEMYGGDGSLFEKWSLKNDLEIIDCQYTPYLDDIDDRGEITYTIKYNDCSYIHKNGFKT